MHKLPKAVPVEEALKLLRERERRKEKIELQAKEWTRYERERKRQGKIDEKERQKKERKTKNLSSLYNLKSLAPMTHPPNRMPTSSIWMIAMTS